MAKVIGAKERQTIENAKALARLASGYPASKMWIDFDEEADVLYISLDRPQEANETVDLEDQGILMRYRDKKLVGITVLDATGRYGGKPLSPNGKRTRVAKRTKAPK